MRHIKKISGTQDERVAQLKAAENATPSGKDIYVQYRNRHGDRAGGMLLVLFFGNDGNRYANVGSFTRSVAVEDITGFWYS